MLDIDFISGSNRDSESSSSYDAIAIRFKEDQDLDQKIIVIDGGFSDVGDDIVNFITERYGGKKIDLMISTHPDKDHINGLVTVIQQMPVTELLVHQPRNFRADLDDFKNIESLDDLLAYATANGSVISDAFQGATRFNGRIVILGPSEEYYSSLLNEQLDPAARMIYQIRQAMTQASSAVKDLVGKALSVFPAETLDDNGITSPRNNSSVVTLFTFGGKRFLFTADAGIEALTQAADEYESLVGNFSEFPVDFFQAPHHGSRRNVGKTLLNRIFGEPEEPHSHSHTVFIHAASASDKHPSPKVTNALMRRGCREENLAVTNGNSIWQFINSEPRSDYSSPGPYPILPEEE